MKMLKIAAIAATTFLSASAFAAKPVQFFDSIEQAIDGDSKISRLAKQLKRDGFFARGCNSQIIYYIALPQTTEYLTAKADCSFYKPHDGIGFETTYANITFDILHNRDNQQVRVDDTINVSYNTVY